MAVRLSFGKRKTKVWWNRLSGDSGWSKLLREHAEPMIEEAHMDAAQGLHFEGGAANAPVGFFSTVECACGCKNLLTQKTVNRGWTVIRGHKLQMSGIHHNKALVAPHTKHHPKVVSTTSMDSIDRFISAEMDLVTAQLADAINKRTDIEVLIKQLTTKKDKLNRARAAIKEL